MTSMAQQQESLILAKSGHRIHLGLEKLKMTFGSRPLHRRIILKDWENKCIVAMKQQRGVHTDTLHQPQNTNSLRDTGDNTTHIVFEGEPDVKLHLKNIKLGTSANRNPDKTVPCLTRGRRTEGQSTLSPWVYNTYRQSSIY